MSTPARRLKRRTGFTLLELVITLAIISIITSVALPNYRNSVLKARRADAVDAASAVMQAQERWRATNATYSATLAGLNQATTSRDGYYALVLSAVTGAGYRLRFSPADGKGQDKDTGCTAMAVTVTNGDPAYTPATCWSR